MPNHDFLLGSLMARKSFISRHCLMVQDPTKPCNHTNQCPSGWQCDTGPNIVAKNYQHDLPRKSCDDGTYYLKKAYQPACYCHLINDTQVKGLAVPAAVHLAG